MSLEMMREAVHLTAGRAKLEASGNVSLETVRALEKRVRIKGYVH